MSQTSAQAWDATLDQLQWQMTKATFDTWFKNTRLIAHKDDIYTIGVKNAYAKSWLENRLYDTITRALENVTEREVQIEFLVLPPEGEGLPQSQKENGKLMADKEHTLGIEETKLALPKIAPLPPTQNGKVSGGHPLTKNGENIQGPQLKLSNNYTFDRFIVGASNRLAHAASLAVAEKPGEAYNPLFLYGGVGLGKTHLLQAVAHEAIKAYKRVIYVSSETFTNDFINSLRHSATDTFREYYRNTDFLLIDDIQFIAGKESTQEEFFHTFNDIHSVGGQIVLTSDRVPRAIPTLSDRLSSRFEWGLLADVQPPDLETRLAILGFKAENIGAKVPNDVMEFIARRAQNNIRELEGALNKVVAHAALSREEISVEQAKMALHDLVTRRASITIEMVISAASTYYKLEEEELVGSGRSKRVAHPRQMVMYLSREETKASLPQIGEALGGRDHTTVMYGYSKMEKLVEQDEKIRRDAMQVREILYQQMG